MAVPWNTPDVQSVETQIRRFKDTIVMWAPYKGLTYDAAAGDFFTVRAMCDVNELGEISFAPINERSIQHSGKSELTINDGISGSFTVTVEADNIPLLASLMDVSLNDQKSIQLGDGGVFQRDRVGCLLIHSTEGAGSATVKSSTLCYDVSLKFTQAPTDANGDNRWTIEFFWDRAKVEIAPRGYAWATELWYDDGTAITNASAPDGVLVSFTLGTSNEADAGSTPSAEITDADFAAPAFKAYTKAVGIVDATTGQLAQADPSVTTFAAATTIDYSAAPADGARLFAAYVCAVADYPHVTQLGTYWVEANTP